MENADRIAELRRQIEDANRRYHELDAPTIGQFADFLGISQSNATYKVNNLIRKGYIVKENSDTDRREYHLKLSDKFYCYNGLMQSYIDTVMARIHERFTPEELAVDVKEGALFVSARKAPEAAERNFLHRGIATRAFERRFALADHVRVSGAAHEHGMLHIDLVRETPEALKPRRIEISRAAPVQADVVEAAPTQTAVN